MWGCSVEHLGPIQADARTKASAASKLEEGAAKHSQCLAQVLGLLLGVTEIEERSGIILFEP